MFCPSRSSYDEALKVKMVPIYFSARKINEVASTVSRSIRQQGAQMLLMMLSAKDRGPQPHLKARVAVHYTRKYLGIQEAAMYNLTFSTFSKAIMGRMPSLASKPPQGSKGASGQSTRRIPRIDPIKIILLHST